MESNLSRYQPQVLSILRIMAGLLFLSAGLQKWLGIPVANPSYAKITLLSMVGIAGVIALPWVHRMVHWVHLDDR